MGSLRRRLSFAVALVLCFQVIAPVLLASQADAATTVVIVDGRAGADPERPRESGGPGYNTGIDVTGQSVVVSANGSVSIGPGEFYSPQGSACFRCFDFGGFQAPYIGNPWGLIGRIGTSGPWFFIGSGPTAIPSGSGVLHLAVNDNVYDDNGGFWNVAVTTTPPPNLAPTANNDSFTATSGQTLFVTQPGVLHNDFDPEGQPLTAVLVSGPSAGSLSLHPDGGLTYTSSPGYTGPDSFSYRARDSQGAVSANVAWVTVTVVAPLVISVPASLASGMVGAAYGPVSFVATGGTPGYTWGFAPTNLPPPPPPQLPGGMTFSAQGVLSGTPTQSGTFTLDLEVTDSKGVRAQRTYTLFIAPQPLVSIADASVAEGNTGAFPGLVFNFTVSPAPTGFVTVYFTTANGSAISGEDYNGYGGPPYSFVVFNAGETSRTLVIQARGDATVEPNETFFVNIVSVIGGGIADGQAVGTIVNDDAAVATTTVVASTRNPSAVGEVVTFTATVTSSGAAVTQGSVVFTRTAPNGGTTTFAAQVNAQGQVSWPLSLTAIGDHQVSAAYSGAGNFAPSTGSLTQSVRGALSINPASLPDGQVGVAYGPIQLVGSGGTAPYSYAVSGVFPPGVTVTPAGVVSGVPTQTGAFNFNIVITDATGFVTRQIFPTLIIIRAGTSTTVSSSLDPSTYGQAVTFTANVTDGLLTVTAGSVVFRIDGVPAGTVPVVAGQAQYTTNGLSIGTHSVTAEYIQSANFAGSMSGALQQVVNPPNTPPSGLRAVATTANENSPTTLTVSFTDPDTYQTHVVDVNWGDGATSRVTLAAGVLSTTLTHTYSDNAFFFGQAQPYNVSVSVGDGSPQVAHMTTAANVLNVAPTATFANNGPVNEGSAVTVSFTGASDQSSVDQAAGLRFTYQCVGQSGLGNPWSFASTTATAVCQAPLSGTLSIRGRVIDKDNGYTEYTTVVTVNNVAPTGTLTNSGPVDESEMATVVFSNVSDASAYLAALRFSFSCGEGRGMGQLASSYEDSLPEMSAVCLFRDSGSYDVVGRIFDRDGGYSDHTTTIIVNNVAPDVTVVGNTADEDSVLSAFVSFYDPGADEWTATVDYGDGSGPQPLILEGNFANLSHVYAEPGDYTITVTVTDDEGGVGVGIGVATVVAANKAPAANAGGPYAAAEGAGVSLSGSGTDPDGDTLTYAWDLDGDGQFDDASTATAFFSAAGLDGPGAATAKLRVCDPAGLCDTSTTSISITNVAPLSGAITAPVDPQQAGTLVSASASFTDAGTLDTHAAVFDWGDGTTSAATVTAGNATGSHVYSSAGVYTVTLTVTDDDGLSGTSAFEYIVVFDPGAGHVTGGGWINSPAGALAGSSASGKATFGFVSKYLPGRNTPDGATEFQLKAGDLSFHSKVQDWLIVSGSKARYQGTGTVNGRSGHSFQITVWDGKDDGSPDRFRIRIWNSAGVVYDNQRGDGDDADAEMTLGGGSIVIHKR